jgi:hypothetical protein
MVVRGPSRASRVSEIQLNANALSDFNMAIERPSVEVTPKRDHGFQIAFLRTSFSSSRP